MIDPDMKHSDGVSLGHMYNGITENGYSLAGGDLTSQLKEPTYGVTDCFQ